MLLLILEASTQQSEESRTLGGIISAEDGQRGKGS